MKITLLGENSRKNLATFQLKQAKRKFKIDQPLFKEMIFQPFFALISV